LPGDRLQLRLNYEPRSFTKDQVELIARRYLNALARAAEQPELRLYQLDLLSDEERRTLLEGFNATAHVIAETNLVGLIEAQAARTPDAMAVIFDEISVRYSELNENANRLAHCLIRSGAGPE